MKTLQLIPVTSYGALPVRLSWNALKQLSHCKQDWQTGNLQRVIFNANCCGFTTRSTLRLWLKITTVTTNISASSLLLQPVYFESQTLHASWWYNVTLYINRVVSNQVFIENGAATAGYIVGISIESMDVRHW